MTHLTFDTLKIAQRLRDVAKFSPEEAEGVASVLSDALSEWKELQQLATKSDINLLRMDTEKLRADVEKQGASLRADIETLQIRIEGNLREMELRLKLQTGAMIFALGGVLIAIKFFGH